MKFDMQDEYAFTAWISLKLDPIIRNDPKKTAAYVVALLKKNIGDKDPEGMKLLCKSKLQAFVENKEKLTEFCNELFNAVEDGRYLEVKEHPSYATLLDDVGPLTSANKELPKIKTERRFEDRSRSLTPDDSSRRRPMTIGTPRSPDAEDLNGSADEAIEDQPPIPVTADRIAAVGSNISVDDLKRLGQKRTAVPRLRCKDFNERGYCMRGQFCPFDHGTDPVVWQNSRPMEIRYNAPPRVPVMGPQPGRLPGFPPMMPLMRPVMPPRFRPEGPGMPPFIRQKPGNLRPRELLGLPTGVDPGFNFNSAKREGDMGGHNEGPSKRIAMSDTANNCTLEIRNIPPPLNSIAALNGHFSKYGSIVNVQVRYDNDQTAALVTFQTQEAANRAFHSPEPVLNNRFIVISWHRDNLNAAASRKPVVGPVAPANKPDSDVPHVEPSAVNAEEPTESAVTQGFTQGVKVRYPVGTRRARSVRYRGGSSRGRGQHSNQQQSQQPPTNTHHQLIAVKISITKARDKLESNQSQIDTLQGFINKLNTSIQSYQQTTEQYRQRLENDPSGNKEEISTLLDKFEKQILQWQQELMNREKDRDIARRERTQLEEELAVLNNKVQKLQIQSEALDSNGNGESAGMSNKESDSYQSPPLEAPKSRPGYAIRTVRGRLASFRGTRSPRRTTGVARFRRASRGGPFNLTVDRRPKRLRISGFDESESATLLHQIREFGGSVIEVSGPEEVPYVLVDFVGRYDAETFLRDIAPVMMNRKLISSWVSEDLQSSELERSCDPVEHDCIGEVDQLDDFGRIEESESFTPQHTVGEESYASIANEEFHEQSKNAEIETHEAEVKESLSAQFDHDQHIDDMDAERSS